MKENKEVKISYWAAHFTTIVSVSLVLLLLALIAEAWIVADSETRRLKERLEICVVMADSVSDGEAASLARAIAEKPYAAGVRAVTGKEALDAWTAETGEDLEQLFGVNPLSPEVTFSVKADYASASNLETIRRSLLAVPGVASVDVPESEMVESMNRNIARLTAVLGAMAAMMLIISFVLINNTVHLTIYSRRFSIHTMQLVGATDGFIRRPVVMNNLLSGLLAGIVAVCLLGGILLFSTRSGYIDALSFQSWPVAAAVAGGTLLVGMLMCAAAAWTASSRYLHKHYDELFR